MKKLYWLMLAILLTSCQKNTEPSSKYTEEEKAEVFWKTDYADVENGFTYNTSIRKSEYYHDGVKTDDIFLLPNSDTDAKYIFYNDAAARLVNVPEGFAITLPYTSVTADFSLSTYRSRYTFNDGVLTTSYQNKSPYSNDADGWNIYLTEWISRFISNNSFLRANQLERIRQSSDRLDLIENHQVIQYDILIKNNEKIAFPFYHIAIIRPLRSYTAFYLFVYKAKENKCEEMDKILASFTPFKASGKCKIHAGQYEVKIPKNWNKETKSYYQSLLKFQHTDWGFFSASMVDNTHLSYAGQELKIQREKERFETTLDFQFGIMPTYTHIGYGNTMHHFPVEMAQKFAGGNEKNNKPVLQFTYQFTTSNNGNLEGYTPMFDILRGKYDDHFHRLAKDIKSYAHPVLFRLNNEMNTDWTSYAGIVTLCDPDIFIETWKHLYHIFQEEKVNNCIWIFNPGDISTPYCNWGEDLTYMPGADYVQILGLTAYEMGNTLPFTSFAEKYQTLYLKNKERFQNYPWVISEFACGSGGAYNYETRQYDLAYTRRNAAQQAQWIAEMFDCFKNRNEEGYEYVRNIVGAIWFSTNDYAYSNGTYYPSNYLALDSDLTQSLENFKIGLRETK